jgi:hypothetical protein
MVVYKNQHCALGYINLFGDMRLLHVSATVFHLTPKYINIKVNGHNQRSEHTKTAATRIRMNKEIKFLYRKKQHLNELLYHTHLECSTSWASMWQHIQNEVDSFLHTKMDAIYHNLNKNKKLPP